MMVPKRALALPLLVVFMGCAGRDPSSPGHPPTCAERVVGGVWQSEVSTRLPADAPAAPPGVAPIVDLILLVHSVRLEFLPTHVQVSSTRDPRRASRAYRVTADTQVECDVTVDPDGREPVPYHFRFVDDNRAFVRVNFPDNPIALREEAWVRQRR